MQNRMTNLITLYTQNIKTQQSTLPESPKKEAPATALQTSSIKNANLISAYLNNQANINSAMVKPVQTKQVDNLAYKNELKKSFMNNEVKMLAIIPRTFNAKDKNKDAIIGEGE